MYSFVDEVLNNSNTYNWIMFGAGAYGKAFVEKYCLTGIIPMPKYICDNDKNRWNTDFIAGIEIKDPMCIMKEDYNKTVIVVATHWMAIVDQLRHMGAYYFMVLTSKAVEDALFIRQNEERFHKVEEMLTDDLSKELFHTKVQDLRRGIVYAPSCISFNPYYGNDVIPTLRDDEVIVAGGCYNGEHIDRALELNHNVKCYAFEPNKKYAELLREKYYGNEKIIVKENGLFDKSVELCFDNTSDLSAHVVGATSNEMESLLGNTERICAVRLDEAISDNVSLIWMDIEGSELSALKGSHKTIKENHPKMAICVYHMIEHYVEVAEQIKAYSPDYRLYFRHHTTMDLDSVLYAV